MHAVRRLLRTATLATLTAAASVLAGPAGGQFATTPAPAPHEASASAADSLALYRRDAAAHLYASYPLHVHKGKLPPLMYAVAMTETDIDQDGQVTAVRFVREPAAAKEVMPWIAGLIRRAAPFPAPLALSGTQTVTEVWLVDRTGRFQLHTLSEGQLASSTHASAD